jgi:hypothetical protein
MAELFGRPLGQQAAAIDDEDIGAARGFVHIGGADDHAQVLALDQLFENGPQIATRQRIDADAGLVEQEQVGRADQRAGKAELLLHAPDSFPAGRAVKRAMSVISSIRENRSRRCSIGTPWRSA